MGELLKTGTSENHLLLMSFAGVHRPEKGSYPKIPKMLLA